MSTKNAHITRAFYYHSDHLGSAAYLTNDAGQVSQTLNYLPYGEDWVDIHYSLDYRLGQYTFTGKERDEETGYGYFGARYMDHELMAMWLSVDPMADKYPGISPYAYCAWNPVKLVDPDGNRIVFVNGLLAFGSPEGGRKYWGNTFVSGAKEYFHDNTVPYFTNVDYGVFSSAKDRRIEGYNYAKENFASLTEGMTKGETFKFVAHSMGGAFAMGMKDYFEEQGWNVESMVFINAYQGDGITVEREDPSFIVDYQYINDLVLLLGRGEIKNSDLIIRTTSKESLFYRHAAPLHGCGKKFWEDLQRIIDSLQSITGRK